ncbi:MAG TPA: aminotransferase class V-fold PLP-dependent enzyme [Pyrinomonadaceae bacterium]|nr:aminotransferase class V-fold PLP-dependent enzyme [Pyrinomonadaceae bacterium]
MNWVKGVGPGVDNTSMIYFDNNATTQIAPEVCEAMLPFLGRSFGNPSSAYGAGRDARSAVERARISVAKLLGADAAEIAFTSGGTESDNWAIRGALTVDASKKHIVTTRVEHEAVRKLCELLQDDGYTVTWLEVDENGLLDLDNVRSSLRPDTAIVSVMLANNETGVLFPVREIGQMVHEGSDALFHVDAVNAVGKIPIDLSDGAIDLLSLSAHKFHGPKGVGALYVRNGIHLPSSSVGGGQESGRRAGTEAVHQIAGLGAAAELVRDLSVVEPIRHLRDKLENTILSDVPGTYVNGSRETRLPNTSNISFENLNGEMILAALDDTGICVSTGSACHAGYHTASPVLQAMNIPYTRAMGSIRFSLGRYNTEDEVDRVIVEVKRVVEQLKVLGT